jgi:hypothetical protein
MIDVRKSLISPTGELPRRWSFQPCAGSRERVPCRRAAGLAGTGLRLLPEPPERRESEVLACTGTGRSQCCGTGWRRVPSDRLRRHPARVEAEQSGTTLISWTGSSSGSRSGPPTPPARPPQPGRPRHAASAGSPLMLGDRYPPHDRRRSPPTPPDSAFLPCPAPTSRMRQGSAGTAAKHQPEYRRPSPDHRSSSIRPNNTSERWAPRGSNPQPAD